MCNQRKAVDCRRLHTTVDQEGVVVTNERKANDADCLEDPRLNDCESQFWVALQFRG